MDRKPLKLKKIVITSALAAAAFLGLVFNGLFGSSKQIIDINEEDELLNESSQTLQQSGSLAFLIRQWILKMPLPLRILLCLPLWFLGQLLIRTGAKAVKTVLPLAAAAAGKYLIILAVLFIVVVLCAKLIDPEVTLKEIFTRKTLIILFSAVLLMGLFDFIGPRYYMHYDEVEFMLSGIISLIALIWVEIPIYRKEKIARSMGLREPDEPAV